MRSTIYCKTNNNYHYLYSPAKNYLSPINEEFYKILELKTGKNRNKLQKDERHKDNNQNYIEKKD